MVSLESEIISILSKWGKGALVHIQYFKTSDSSEQFGRCTLGGNIAESISNMRWVTPERLDRERNSIHATEIKKMVLRRFLWVVEGGDENAV